MTLTNIVENSVINWSADITEKEAMVALHLGLQAMFPGQVPDVDLQETADNIVLRNKGLLAAHARGTGVCRVEIKDETSSA